MSHIIQKATFILMLLVILGAALRFYDLNWGSPYYFHPDERNIANSITQLSYPTQLNPKFFAYGSLPIYSSYAAGLSMHLFRHTFDNTVSFTEAIVISRIYSTLFSLLLIPLIYLIGKELKGKITGIIAAFLATFSVGFIQFAHFGTFEMWLTFWSGILFYACLRYYQTTATKWLLTIGIAFGILCSVKISSAALFPLVILAISLNPKLPHKVPLVQKLKKLLIASLLASGIYFLTNPFAFLDVPSFLESMRYESSVASGSLPVFYTGEFVAIFPILYPFISIYPFLLNPLMTILFIPAFCYLSILAYRTKSKTFLLLIASFLLLFLSQAFLYVQWTRYYVPTIPYIILVIAIALDAILQSKYKKVATIGIGVLFIFTIVYAIAFTITTYVEKDTRLQAAAFAGAQIQSDAQIISEVYDLGILPFNEKFGEITLYDFYSLDGSPTSIQMPPLTGVTHIILPSQRIMKVRMQNPKVYPKGYAFYQDLTTGKLGYKKIYQTPCSIWCKIVYFNDPLHAFEGTASVFDRPIVTIFQKQ